MAPLKLEMKDVELVKPSKLTPSCILSLSTIDNKDGYNNFGQTVHVYRSSSTTHDSNSSVNPCHVFKEALSKALFYYYPLAGIIYFVFVLPHFFFLPQDMHRSVHLNFSMLNIICEPIRIVHLSTVPVYV
jgi:hypothetical protein